LDLAIGTYPNPPESSSSIRQLIVGIILPPMPRALSGSQTKI